MTDEEFLKSLQEIDKKDAFEKGVAQSTLEYLGTTASNIIPSGKQLLKDTVQIFIDPIGTADTLEDLVTGGILNLVGGEALLYDSKGNVLGKDEQGARKREVANNFGQYLKERYGGIENVKESFKTDPVGVVADISMFFTGGASVTTKGGTLNKIAQKGADFTDPIIATIRLGQNIKSIMQSGARIGADKLSNTSGMLSTSYQLGKLDNTPENRQKKQDFFDARSGKISPQKIVDNAIEALKKANADMKNAFKGNKASLKLSEFNINPKDVANRLIKIIEDNPDFSDQAMKSVERVMDMVAKWENNPSKHTLEGLDALKRSIFNSTPSGIMKTTSDVANPFKIMSGEIYNIIAKQAPDYVPVMNAYAEANDLQRVLSREFNYKPSDPNYTSMLRALNQAMRDNINTNAFGTKMDSLNKLDDLGDTNILEQVAGLNAKPYLSTGLPSTAGMQAMFYAPVRAGMSLIGGSPNIGSRIAYGAGAVDRRLDPLLQGLRDNALALQAGRQAGVADRVSNEPTTFLDAVYGQRPNQTLSLIDDSIINPSVNYLRGLLMGEQ
tara:strand:+ start:7745 stop:9409 length:1665 start_codon:yes stop_codon:yes gene_type:complete